MHIHFIPLIIVNIVKQTLHVCVEAFQMVLSLFYYLQLDLLYYLIQLILLFSFFFRLPGIVQDYILFSLLVFTTFPIYLYLYFLILKLVFELDLLHPYYSLGGDLRS